MPNLGTIQLIERSEIDDTKWNNCISNSANGLLYSYTWYLDCFAENWFGLVYEDYQSVMALPFKNKVGIYYIYQPALIPQLGLMGNDINSKLFEAVIQAIPDKYKLIDYSIANQLTLKIPNCSVSVITNYTLELNKEYDLIKNKYRNNTLRNIAKKKEEGKIIKLPDTAEVIELAKKQFQDFPKNVISALNKYIALNSHCPKENSCINYAYQNKNGKIEAVTSIMFSHNRIYYLIAASTKEGKALGASHKITDTIIKDYAGSNHILDFEGSDIEGIAFFYSGFGAKKEQFQRLYINRMNFLLKLLTAK